MSKTITLHLRKDLIIEAVKADTFQRAQADKSDNPIANAARAYAETAGDETFHERKLVRNLRSGLAKFATMMNEFVDTENGSLTYTLSDQSNDITVAIVVTDRYNSGLAQPLASLAEDYIVFIMDGAWWRQFKSELANEYYNDANETLNFIRLCLAKTAPSASSASYADVTGDVTGDGVASITFTSDTYSATMGQSFDSPQPTTTPSGLALTYSSSNEEVATVNSSGTVTLVGAGTAVITARFAGNDRYQSTSAAYTLTVNPA